LNANYTLWTAAEHAAIPSGWCAFTGEETPTTANSVNQFPALAQVLRENHEDLPAPHHIYHSRAIQRASYDSHGAVFGDIHCDSRPMIHWDGDTESFSLELVGLAKSHLECSVSTMKEEERPAFSGATGS
jgi:hypothetical protein